MIFQHFFGGNSIACAAAHAVLDVLEEEKLIQKALSVARYSLDRLKGLRGKFCCIRDVNGAGLFFGVELINDHEAKEPNSILAQKVVNYMLGEGILMIRSGINYNTLKIRPNLRFSIEHSDILISSLEKVLTKLKLLIF